MDERTSVFAKAGPQQCNMPLVGDQTFRFALIILFKIIITMASFFFCFFFSLLIILKCVNNNNHEGPVNYRPDDTKGISADADRFFFDIRCFVQKFRLYRPIIKVAKKLISMIVKISFMKKYIYFFGVDISKKTVDITFIANHEIIHRQFTNDQEGRLKIPCYWKSLNIFLFYYASALNLQALSLSFINFSNDPVFTVDTSFLNFLSEVM